VLTYILPLVSVLTLKSEILTKKLPVILSVDDDPDAHTLMKRAILKAGLLISVHFLVNGREVLRYLRREGKYADKNLYPWPDLLISDLKMPEMNGFDLLERIGVDKSLDGLPVIVFSTSDDRRDIEKAVALGCAGYVRKPTNFDELVLLVPLLAQNFLGDRPNEPELSHSPYFCWVPTE
jgi:CheY-like chemotaxis protein